MKPRKTVKIQSVVERANKFMLHSRDDQNRERAALHTFIADILHDTGNYRGFNYLDSRDMQQSTLGTTVGINRDSNGEMLPYEPSAGITDRFDGTDSTRTFFYGG